MIVAISRGGRGPLLDVALSLLVFARRRPAELLGFTVKGVGTHRSLHLRHFSGLLWCDRCAGTAAITTAKNYEQAPLLTKACKGKPAEAAGRAFKRLRALELPSNLKIWPGSANLILRCFVQPGVVQAIALGSCG